ncbi:nSTAND1 domain-containing NTPase [Nonomuraea guangzhouensis]|uniref:TIR domain-containing protein n=1 Tax=Nonomuraea guangzhouensis TaxID=1291555 RepID=A0ABW4GHW6_9ACTN|nr:TIR domain-containing protein [Nonomuraea guangzhouensis]
MARVFISHASDDPEFVREVCDWLHAEGHDPFLNEHPVHGIDHGEEWHKRLYHELLRTDAVVCVVTPKYLMSVWCAAEIAIADAHGRLLLPLNREPGLGHPLMQRFQHVHYDADPAEARERVAKKLRGLDAQGRQGWREGENPFPGLDPFTGANGIFVGRDAEAKELVRILRRPAGPRFLAVAGPSGCGKTSLLLAGFLPSLDADRWLATPPIRPGEDPVSALSHALTAAARGLQIDWSPSEVRAVLGEGERALLQLAGELLARARPRSLVLVVDQSEELFTRSGAAAGPFAALLREAISDEVRLVAAIRGKFLSDLVALPELAGVDIGTHMIRPLDTAMLHLVVEEPARVAGLRLDAELAGRLVSDTRSGTALPLLAFTLHELAENLSRGGTLSASRYAEIGGVGGALMQHADRALDRAIADSGLTREQVLAGLVRLVTLDDEGRRASRPVEPAALPEAVRAAFATFVNERLLTEVIDDDRVRVGVAHEALLTEWPALNTAIADQEAVLATARSVEQAAAEWAAAGRTEHFLWDARRLIAVEASLRLDAKVRGQPESDRVVPLAHLDPTAQEFLSANRARIRTRRRRRRVLVAGVAGTLSIVLVLALVAVRQQRAAEEARTAAHRARLVGQSSLLALTARQLRDSDVWLARQLSLIAYNTSHTAEARGSMLDSSAGHLVTRVPASVGIRGPHTLAVRPDGRLLASSNQYGNVVLTDTTDPQRPATRGALQAGRNAVLTMAFSPDGVTLAVGGIDWAVRLFDVSDPTHPRLKEPFLRGAHSAIQSAAFRPDGTILAAASADGTILLWDTARHRRLGPPLIAPSPLRPRPAVRAVAFTPDGRTLVAGYQDGSVWLWNVADPRRPRLSSRAPVGPRGTVFSVAISRDGDTLAAGDDDGKVWTWRLADGDALEPPDEPLTGLASYVNSVAFGPDGKSLAAGGSDGTVLVWDLPNREPAATLPHPAQVTAVAFTAGGAAVATAAYDGTARLWAVPSPVLAGPTQGVFSVEYSPDGKTLAGGSRDGKVWRWDVSDGRRPLPLRPLASTVKGLRYNGVAAFSPDGRTLAAASREGTIQLWDVSDPRRPRPSKRLLTGAHGHVNAMAFGPGGGLLAAGGDDMTVRLWNVAEPGRPRFLAAGPPTSTSFVQTVAFSPDGTTLAVGSDDGSLALLNVTNPARPVLLTWLGQKNFASAVLSAAFSRDGKILAVGRDDRTLQVWDLAEPRRPAQLALVLTGPGHPSHLVFSPVDGTLASANTDHTVSLWDMSRSSRPTVGTTLTGPADDVFAVAFSPDGKSVAASGLDRKVRIWSTDPSQVAAAICTTTGRPFTEEEWHTYVAGLPYKQPC